MGISNTFSTFFLVTFLGSVLKFHSVTAQRGPVDFYDCSGKRDGNYIHPYDCSKFIACVASRYAYEMDCSAGLNYDPVSDRCDYPELVGCIVDPPDGGPTTSPSTIPSTTTTITPSTSTPSTTTTTTPTTTPTTPSTTTPTTPSTTTPSTTTTTNPTTTPTTTPTTPSTTTMSTPTTASSTVSTTVSSSTTQTPSSTISTTQPTTSTSLIPPIYNCSGLPDGNYKHPTNCSKFIACVAGEYAYEMECPAGLHYDPRTDRCDYPDVVGCDPNASTTTSTSTSQSSTTGQTESTTSSLTTSAPPTNSTTTIPPDSSSTTVNPDSCDHDCEYVGIDCHNYYSCINFTLKEYHECPYEQGLAFNPALKVCDRIENVEGCRPNPTSTTTTPPPEEDCVCEYKPHETDCSKYYFCPDSCRRSSCEIRTCPGDLLWSVDFYGDGTAHQQCTVPENASCASRDSGSARLEFTCFRKRDGLYEHEGNCHSYWKCKEGVALLYACPKGFIYNPEVKSCDFPGKALKYCVNQEI